MNEIEFAERYLYPYKLKGDEILPMYCPECGGGNHRDKYTFALNTSKHTYNCMRGSCGAKGTFSELAKEKGERADYMREFRERNFERTVVKKVYKNPEIELKNISKVCIDYLKLRGISEETIKHFDLKSDKNGNIIFPYFDENKDHVLNKFRLPRQFRKGIDKAKMWQEGEGKPVLFGMDKIDTDKPLVITEGEIDCLAVFESGYKNVTSIPFGTNNMEWINECWDWLKNFNEIILWFDNDDPGKKAADEVSKKLGIYKCKVISCNEFKDANIVLYKLGKTKVLEYIQTSNFVPIENLVRLSECKNSEVERIRFGNKFLDYQLGGCRMSEVTIWTGKRGSGKSTVLNQTMADTVEQGIKLLLYSGEISNPKAKQWFDRQVAGSEYIVSWVDEFTGREEYGVDKDTEKKLSAWYNDYIFTYGDDGEDSLEDILEVMEYAYRRHNVKRYILDNLKTIRHGDNKDFYRQQANTINALRKFVKKYNVHIDLVVHPRKTSNRELEDEDVGGSSDIIDLAHNIIEVRRISKKEKEEIMQKTEDELTELDRAIRENDTILKIKKNREYGDVDDQAFYRFDYKSKRIYGKEGNVKKYSWNKLEIEKIKEEEEIPPWDQPDFLKGM